LRERPGMPAQGGERVVLRYLVALPLKGGVNDRALARPEEAVRLYLGLFNGRLRKANKIELLGLSPKGPEELAKELSEEKLPGTDGLTEAKVMFFRWRPGRGGDEDAITIALFLFVKEGDKRMFNRLKLVSSNQLLPLCRGALARVLGEGGPPDFPDDGHMIVVSVAGRGANLDMAYEAGLLASANEETLRMLTAPGMGMAQNRLPMIKALYKAEEEEKKKRLGPISLLLRTQNAVLYHERDDLIERYERHLVAIAVAFVALRQELKELREELAGKDREILRREEISSQDYEDMASYKARLVDLLEEVHGPLSENDVTNALYFKIRDGCGLASLAEAVEKEMELLEKTIASMVGLRQSKVGLELSERSFRISDALFSFRKGILGLNALLSTAFSITIAAFLTDLEVLASWLGVGRGLEFGIWMGVLWPLLTALTYLWLRWRLEPAMKRGRLDRFLKARRLRVPGLGTVSCVVEPDELYSLAGRKDGLLDVRITSDIQHHEERGITFSARWRAGKHKRDYLVILRFTAIGKRYPISMTIEARGRAEPTPSLLRAARELLANLMREGVLKIEGVGSVEGHEEAVAEAMLPQTS